MFGGTKKTVEVGGFTFLRLLGESWLLVRWLQLGGDRSALGPSKKERGKTAVPFYWVMGCSSTCYCSIYGGFGRIKVSNEQAFRQIGYVCLTHFYKVCICNTFFGPPQDTTMFDDS